ncbi:uncharacterized protein FTOL_13977 [Fusarium torulosum]|uniref:Uncharacterized protein n=1 Tax=Fusarium torulosum TaxID=33205 RepID=A0AAE8MP63_9HYPO|nr:uncharacterized protein FTOL_13977 [Fusarium torulosum]
MNNLYEVAAYGRGIGYKGGLVGPFIPIWWFKRKNPTLEDITSLASQGMSLDE